MHRINLLTIRSICGLGDVGDKIAFCIPIQRYFVIVRFITLNIKETSLGAILLGAIICMSSSAIGIQSITDSTILDRLIPGQADKAQVKELVGSPYKVTKIQNLPKDWKHYGELWEYKDGKQTRLSIFFLSGSDLVYSWTWHVPSGNPEQNLKSAMSRYAPKADWKPGVGNWINPHSYPNTCYFKNEKLGVSIEYNRARKEVFTITRTDSSRKLASSKGEESPTYCIDGSCAPGIPAKEFFRDLPISKYCEMPN